MGNFLIFILLVKDKILYRVFYYFLLDFCCLDIFRFVICFLFVFNFVKNGFIWIYGILICKVIVFLGVLFCFYIVFMFFCISVIRYLVIVYYRFYIKRLIFWTCLVVICMVWILFVVMVFFLVLDVGIYFFIREED